MAALIIKPVFTCSDPALAHRRLVCGFTLVMMGLSWPLWWHQPELPVFPVLSNATLKSLDQSLLLACLAGLALAFSRRLGRFGCLLAFLAGIALVFHDQNRLQAWFYQTLLITCLYAFLPGAVAIGFARFFAVALYFHSGLSKLDHSFAYSMGPYLLQPVLQFWPKSWGAENRLYFILALPVGELIASLLLATGRWKTGLAGVLFMHVGLLALLGPWALDHSGNVLTWNISMACQAFVLFGANPAGNDSNEAHVTPNPLAFGLIQLLFLAVAVMPFFERAGLWDAWPSFALYAGHVEQLRLDLPRNATEMLPGEFQPFLKSQGDRTAIDLTLWSRARLGVPPYPALRMQKGLARYVAAQCPPELPLRAIFAGKANWRTGKREELILEGRQAILELK